jgi:5,10-methylene-tetrahydrofolate dehydrogenase/methenyl tetrahydrofolate cyclohydrolase
MVKNVIDGKAVAAKIRAEISAKVQELKAQYKRVSSSPVQRSSQLAVQSKPHIFYNAPLSACTMVETCAPKQVPGLAVVIVGERQDSQTYVRMKKKACEEVGASTLPSMPTNRSVSP